ncbi:MAG: hypothetical protein R3F29_04650 [Planctomycetota bacterium]
MTTLDPIPDLTPPTEAWNDLFARLQLRYPKVREPIVAALAALMQNPGCDADHAKAVAAANGMRITAASVAAADRLLSRQDGDGDPTDSKATKTAGKGAASNTARARRQRTPTTVDPEALIRGVVTEIQNAGNAEADRLRDAMHRAISLLQEAARA